MKSYFRVFAQLGVVAVLTVALQGCSSSPTRQQLGIGGGAVIGGVLGNVLTNGSTAGTVGGAAVGGVVGNEVSKKK